MKRVHKKRVKYGSFIFILMLIFMSSDLFIYKVSAATVVTAPTSVRVTTSDNGDPIITWKKHSKAVGYRVYRRTSSNSAWVSVETTKNNKLIDKKWVADSNSTVEYAVSAYVKKNGSTIWSKKSNIVKWKVPAYSKGLEYELNAKKKEYWVVGLGTCTDTNLIFPTRYKGLPVTRIENLEECSNIKGITISASITEIGDMAFRLCTGLTEITIPKNVVKIERNPFAECNSIQSIIVDSKNPYYDSRNGCNAIIETATNSLIAGCVNTQIPDDIYHIGDYAFIGFDTLTDISLPSQLQSIGNNAFRECSNLNNVAIPESVSFIDKGAFAGCTKFTCIILPKKLTQISAFTFFECSNLESVSIPESVNVIDEFAFRECTSLKAVTLPKGITQIYAYSFGGCESLTEIDIPDSVTSIEYDAFFHCYSLAKVKFPKSLTYIGEQAFYDCESLVSITIPEGITTVNEFTFWGCSSLKEVNLPNSVITIEEGAFSDCGLVDLPKMKNVISIGPHAFECCLSLRDITIPNSVKEIGANAFFLTNLCNVTIPNTVKTIGAGAFWQHVGLNLKVKRNSYADTQLREYGYNNYMSYSN